MVEFSDEAATMLSTAGWSVKAFSPTQLVHGIMHDAIRQMAEGGYQLVWMTMPPSRSSSRHRVHACLHEMAAMVRRAKQCHVPAVLMGTPGPRWKHEDIRALSRQQVATVSSHLLCHFCVKFLRQRSEPSGAI